MHNGTDSISLLMAFTAGILAFLSPCVLPIVPAYISYLTGVSFREISSDITNARRRKIRIATVAHSVCFILGFTVTFVLLGATVTVMGKALLNHQAILRKIGGVAIIVFAMIISGIIKIPFLTKEIKFSYRKKSISLLGSFLVGATFAIAWTPCVGPILGSILIYASSEADMRAGIKLLTFFSLGLGTPFFLSAFIVNSVLSYINKIARYLGWIKALSGIILATFGIRMLIWR
ncbi:MAG: sulfite exporter TauE/SafE family protein [Candidatus Omnitrophica bacterium]|nr:sulfite exporter TauE/SafE family protein [Candidatus Omnitrophota bacterium]